MMMLSAMVQPSYQMTRLVRLEVIQIVCLAFVFITANDYECLDAPLFPNYCASANETVHYWPLNVSRFGHDFTATCRDDYENRRYLVNASFCPWTYVVDFDYDRFPHQMLYARCSCGICNRGRSVCRALYHSQQVVRRSCLNGIAKYRFVFESLPVACVCTRREEIIVE